MQRKFHNEIYFILTAKIIGKRGFGILLFDGGVCIKAFSPQPLGLNFSKIIQMLQRSQNMGSY